MRVSGFTLIEMMITITVAAILLAVAIPSFQTTINNLRVVTQTNELVTDLILAKSEAIKRGAPVSACVRNAAGTGCAGAGTWDTGWLIFTDANSDGIVTTAAGDTILKVHEALSTGSTISSTFTSPVYITYSAMGSLSATGTFQLCRSGYNGRVITIQAATGRTNIAPTTTLCP